MMLLFEVLYILTLLTVPFSFFATFPCIPYVTKAAATNARLLGRQNLTLLQGPSQHPPQSPW